MLLAINERIKGWLGAFVVALITLPFALWGINSYFEGGGLKYAAKVNDLEITPRDFELAYAQQKQRLSQQFQGNIPYPDKEIKKQVLERLINQKLLENVAADEGYNISDETVYSQIREIFSKDGVFDKELFQSVVASRGGSEQLFMYELKNEILLQQIQNGIIGTNFVTKEDVKRFAGYKGQTRDVELLRFDLNKISRGIEVSDEEVDNFYKSNQQLYMTPEKVSVDYVELKSNQLRSNVSIDEARLHDRYNDYKTNESKKEKRKASHILIKASGDNDDALNIIDDIKSKLKKGSDFGELAKKYSQDPGSGKNGGDLGWVETGQMVKPFEEALFAMKKGDVSDVVKTQFGYHLIKLFDVKGVDVKTFEQMRPELEAEQLKDLLASAFYDASEAMAVSAYENPDSLKPVVDSVDIKLNVKTSPEFTRYSGQGVASNNKVRQVAFSNAVLSEGLNSEVIEVSPDHIVILRLRDHKAPTLKPLTEVKAQIEKNIKNDKAKVEAAKQARQAMEKAASSASLASLKAPGVNYESAKDVSREDTKLGVRLVNEIFETPPAENDKPGLRLVENLGDEVVLVSVNAVKTPTDFEKAKLDTLDTQLRQNSALVEYEALMKTLTDKAEISRNSKILE